MANQTLEQAIQQVIAGINQRYMEPPVSLQQQIAEFLLKQKNYNERFQNNPGVPLSIKIGDQPATNQAPFGSPITYL